MGGDRFKLGVAAAAAFAIALSAGPPRADAAPPGDIGIGIIIGQPTGLTLEFFVASSQSIDLAIGLDAFNRGGFYVHGDYLFYLPALVSGGSVMLSPYLGPGIFVAGRDPSIGVRVPFGLSLDFRAAPLKLFLEVAPHLRLVRDVDLGIGAAAGFRFFF
jgi:hypothetical protein